MRSWVIRILFSLDLVYDGSIVLPRLILEQGGDVHADMNGTGDKLKMTES